MVDSNLTLLMNRRRTVKSNVTRIKNVLSVTMSTAELECRLSLIEAYFKELLSIQTEIEILNEEDNTRSELEELCVLAKAKSIELLGDNYKKSHEASFIMPATTSGRKLPKLQIPTFSGKYSEYKRFISSFNQMVDSESNLAKIDKFNHLLQCLSGQALDAVRSFQITEENYNKALSRLRDRYDNKTLIVMEHISDLHSLVEIKKTSARNLRSLVDSASAIYSSLMSIGNLIDINSALIIFIISQKTDTETQRKWKESMDFNILPSWSIYSSFLEKRCKYLDSNEPNLSLNDTVHDKKKIVRPQKDTFSFHARLQKRCASCNSAEHWLSGCNKFKAEDVSARFNTVRKLGLCLNCLAEGHGVKDCQSKCKCKVCNKLHHTLLHRWSLPNNTINNNISTNDREIVSVHTHMNESSTNVILATASIFIQDSSGNFKLGRA